MDASTATASAHPDATPSAALSTEEMLRTILQALLEGRTLAFIQGIGQDKVDALYAFAHSLYERERYEDARKVFTYLMALDHHETRYMGAVAACLQMLKRYDEAIEHYCLASVYDLGDPRPTFHTAECLLAQGRTDEARDALSMVLNDCRESRHAVLKERAQALLDLLDKRAGTTAPEGMPS